MPHYLNSRYLSRRTNLNGLSPRPCDGQARSPGCVASIDQRTIESVFLNVDQWHAIDGVPLIHIHGTPLMASAEQRLSLSLESRASIAQFKMTVSDHPVSAP